MMFRLFRQTSLVKNLVKFQTLSFIALCLLVLFVFPAFGQEAFPPLDKVQDSDLNAVQTIIANALMWVISLVVGKWGFIGTVIGVAAVGLPALHSLASAYVASTDTPSDDAFYGKFIYPVLEVLALVVGKAKQPKPGETITNPAIN